MARLRTARCKKTKPISLGKSSTKLTGRDELGYSLRQRRSSMRVNLSFVSNLSDAEEQQISPPQQQQQVRSNGANAEEAKDVEQPTQPSESDAALADEARTSSALNSIEQKELELNRSCMQLKDAIMSKTRALFDKGNELARKTSKILTGHALPEPEEIDKLRDNSRTPSIRVDISKNQQIVMSGDGREKHPVQVNSMLKAASSGLEKEIISSQASDQESMNLNQSIVSTPKKSKIDSSSSSTDQNTGRASELAIKIPVARLFVSNEPSNSIFDVNLIQSAKNCEKLCVHTDKANASNQETLCNTTSKLNCNTSPILSQANTKSRFSRLALKKRITTQASFINRPPFISSSCIEKQNQTCNPNSTDQACNTICLQDATSNSQVANMQDSASISCMEITRIPSGMPIICRSFQNIIQTSLELDNSINNNNQYKANHDLQSHEKCQINNSYQEDCSNTTIRTSLNVNTSIDKASSADCVAQKENKTPNNADQVALVSKKNRDNQDVEAVAPNQSTFIVPTLKKSCIKKSQKKLVTNNQHQMRKPSDTVNTDSLKVTKNLEQEYTDLLVSQSAIDSSKKKKCHYIDQESGIHNNQETQNHNKEGSKQPTSANTARFSMQVNTSLDSIRASPIKHALDFNKMLQESSSSNNESNFDANSSTDKNTGDEHELQNMCLMDRLKNISTFKRNQDFQDTKSLKKSCRMQNASLKNRKSMDVADRNANSRCKKKSCTFDDTNESDDQDSNDKELQTVICKNARSPLSKSSSVYARKNSLCPKLKDTFIIDSSDESSESGSEKERVTIGKSKNATRNPSNRLKSCKKSDQEPKIKKLSTKRKLYALQENSQLISFSPADIQEIPDVGEPLCKKKKRKRQQAQLKKARDKPPFLSPELGNDIKSQVNEIFSEIIEKKKKKPRKILRKKIIIKKCHASNMLNDLKQDQDFSRQRSNERNSLREFDLRRLKKQENLHKSHRIVVVVTGLSRGDKDLVKSAMQSLGSAILQAHVTPRTTHVISSGVRTMNLLKGILRGCWLLSLEWALKSLENGKWLDPSPYEMSHFAKAVQENRRDRQLFGKGYVPELFVTCGLIYIENGTSPPAPVLKELIKIAGGRITEDPIQADIEIGSEGLKEIWILDSITTGEIQSTENYKRN